MSERIAYDALPRHIPRETRSKLLDFDSDAVARDHRAEEDAKIPEFTYDELPTNKKRIRLLRLWPGVLENPQIDCEMFEAEFDKKGRLVRVSKETDESEGSGSALEDGDDSVSATDDVEDSDSDTDGEEDTSNSTTDNDDGTDSSTDDSKSTGTTTDEEEGTDPADQRMKKEDIVEYEALSWRWGDEAGGKYAVMIHKDGKLFRKTSL